MTRTSWPAGTPVEQIAADLGYDIEDHPTQAAATSPLDELVPVPEYPPAGWFDRPDWIDGWRAEHGLDHQDAAQGLRRLTVTDEGRVGGWFYDAGACIFGTNGEACPTPSLTRYAAFHQQEAVLEDGTMLLVGAIGNSAGHVDPDLPLAQAISEYNNPRIQLMRVRAGDDERGGWLAGSLVPAGARVAAGVDPLTYGHVSFLRSCGLSGSWYPTAAGGFDRDWWERNGISYAAAMSECEGYDCIGPQLVTRPALPLRRLRVAAVTEPIVVPGVGDDPCDVCEDDPTGTAPNEGEPVAATDTASNTPGSAVTAAVPPQFQKGGDSGKPAGNGEKAKPDSGSLEQRVAAIERRLSALEKSKQAALHAAVDALDREELPPPDGFDERTIHLTDADRDEIARQAASAKPSPLSSSDRPASQRKQDAKSDVGMAKTGAYPIRNCADAKNARQALGRAAPGDRAKVLAHIAAREKALGCDNGPPPGSSG